MPLTYLTTQVSREGLSWGVGGGDDQAHTSAIFLTPCSKLWQAPGPGHIIQNTGWRG